jgi:peptidylprolyl isomerase domain and WD repeat-containing protein 1
MGDKQTPHKDKTFRFSKLAKILHNSSYFSHPALRSETVYIMTTISVNNESDDEFGPQLVSHDSPKQKKRRIASDWERHHLENLPLAQFYEHSYMHRDVVTHICVCKATEFIITGSQDGHVKFWKKMTKGIEFVKHYQAHLGAINAMEISVDEKQLVTTSSDQMIKFFEIVGFDMSNMIAVNYCPTAAVWLNDIVSNRVGVADKNCSKIRIYSATGTSDPLHEVCIHNHPVS